MKHEFRERATRCQNRAELFFDSKKVFLGTETFQPRLGPRTHPFREIRNFSELFWSGGSSKNGLLADPVGNFHIWRRTISGTATNWSNQVILKAGQELTRGALQLNLRLEAHHKRAPNSYRRKRAT